VEEGQLILDSIHVDGLVEFRKVPALIVLQQQNVQAPSDLRALQPGQLLQPALADDVCELRREWTSQQARGHSTAPESAHLEYRGGQLSASREADDRLAQIHVAEAHAAAVPGPDEGWPLCGMLGTPRGVLPRS